MIASQPVVLDLEEVLLLGDAGVVDEHVDAAPPLVRGGDGSVDCGRVAHVGGVEPGAASPRASIRETSSSSGSRLRPISITSAPSPAKRSAIASPIPWPAPVTMTFFPSNRRAVTLLLSLDGPGDDAADEVALEDEIGGDHG